MRAILGQVFLLARASDLEALAPWIAAAMANHGLDTPRRQAHFLAQIGHESGELRYREELASGAAYEGRRDLGNTEPGDGPRFKGRGLIQLTGRANYTEYDRARGRAGALLRDPGLVARDPELCCDVAGWYWSTRRINALADRDDLEAVTRRVNGGLNGLTDRRRLLDLAKAALLPRATAARETLALQHALNRAGARPPLAADGQLGPLTRAALMAFQRRQGLPASGQADPETWVRLERSPP